MPVKPVTRDAITAALKECGPMTVPELVENLGWSRNRVNTAMTTARNNHPGKFFRIVRYQTRHGSKGRETPVYIAGPGPDAPRPEFGAQHKRERDRSYYQSNRALWAARRKARTGQTTASPWAGLVPMQRRQTTP